MVVGFASCVSEFEAEIVETGVSGNEYSAVGIAQLEKRVECGFEITSNASQLGRIEMNSFAIVQGAGLAICLSENGHERLASKVALDVLILSEINGLEVPNLNKLSLLVENNLDYSNSLRSWALWLVVRDKELDDFDVIRAAPQHIQSMNGSMLGGNRFIAENIIASAEAYVSE
jgi:hypothetical protein